MRKTTRNGRLASAAKRFVLAAAVLLFAAVGFGGIFLGCGHEHTLEKAEGKEATCTEAGVAEHWKCTECGALFSDAAGTKETTESDLAIPASHRYELNVTVANDDYVEGGSVTKEQLTFTIVCKACNDTETVTDVNVDLSAALVVGDNTFTATYGDLTKQFVVTARAEALPTLTARTNKIYHVGETVKKSDLTVTVTYDGQEPVEVSDYTVVNSTVRSGDTAIEVSYAGVTARADATVHEVTAKEEIGSTTTAPGTRAHFECAACNKALNEDFEEIIDLSLPLMRALSATESAVTVMNSDYKKINPSTEQGHTFIGGSSNSYYGRIFMTFNVGVETDTDVRLYLGMCERNVENKVSDVFSVKVNGTAVDLGEELLPYAASDNWFSQVYAGAGKAKLLAGRNNVVEVTRLNLINSALGGNKTYNFYGIGVMPYTETSVTLNAPCTHICPHCGGCTDENSTSAACEQKCAGHDGEHFCAHVCPICGDCTDKTCADEACAAKCGCTEFSVMDSRVTVVNNDGGTVGKNTGEGNVSANDSSARKGLIKITYTIRSDVDTTAKLYIKTCSQAIENTLAESYSFTVEGTPVSVDESIKMPQNEANKWKDIRYTYVGEIHLKAGTNAIEIVRPDMTDRVLNDYTGYNFFGIAVSGNGTFAFAE